METTLLSTQGKAYLAARLYVRHAQIALPLNMGCRTVAVELMNQKIANLRVVPTKQDVMDPTTIWICTSEILYNTLKYKPIGIMEVAVQWGMIAIGPGVMDAQEDHVKTRLLQASALVA